MPVPGVGKDSPGAEAHKGSGGGGVGGGGGGGSGRGRRCRRKRRGGGDNRATADEQHSNGPRTTVGGGGEATGSGTGGVASANFGGSTRGGRGRNGGGGSSKGGPRRRHWGGGGGGSSGNGGEGVNSGAVQDAADRQAILDFQQWVSAPGAPDKAIEAQKNFEADGFVPRYVRQVRHFLRERDGRVPSPRVASSASASTEGDTSAREGAGGGDGLSAHALSESTSRGIYGGEDGRRDYVSNDREPPPEQSGAWNASPENIANSSTKSSPHLSPTAVGGPSPLPLGMGSLNVEGGGGLGEAGVFSDYQQHHAHGEQQFQMNQEEDYNRHPDLRQHQHQHQHQQTYPHVSSSGAPQQGVTFMNQPLPHPQHHSQTSVPTTASSDGSGNNCGTSVGVQSAADNGSWRPLTDARFTSSSNPSAAGPSTDVHGESLDADQRFSPQCGAGYQDPAAGGVSSQASDPSASPSQGSGVVQATPEEEQWTRYLDQATNRHYWNNGKESTWEDPYLKESNLQQQQQQQQQQDQGAWGSGSDQPSHSSTLGFQGPSAYYPGDEMSAVRLSGAGPAGSSAQMSRKAATLNHEAVGDSPAQDAARNGGDLGSGGVIVGDRGQSRQGSGTSNRQLGWDQQPQEVMGSVQASSGPASVQHAWGISGDVAGVAKAAAESGWGLSSSAPHRTHSDESRVAMAPGAGGGAHESAPQSAWGRVHTNQASRSRQQVRARGALPGDEGVGESAWGSPHQNRASSWGSPEQNRESSWGSPEQNPQQQEQDWRQQGQHQYTALDPAQMANRSKLQKAGLDAATTSHLSRQQQHHQQAAAAGSSSFPSGGGGTPAAAQSQAVAEHLRQTQQQQQQGQRRQNQQSGRSAPTTNLGITRSRCGRGGGVGVGGGRDPRGGVHGKGKRGGAQQQQQRGGVAGEATVPEATRSGWGADGSGESLPPASSASPAPASEAQGAEDKEKSRHGRLPPKRTMRNQVGLVYLIHPNGTGVGGPAVSPRAYGPPKVHPSAHLTVRWELPAGAVDGVGRRHRGGDERQRLMVGIFRLGVLSNTCGIISKKLFERSPRPCHDPRQLLFGNVPFYAPKSVGTFVFRIYDASDPVDTLATSHAWQVDAQGKDVELSVRFVLNQLRNADGKGSVMGALAQLAHLLAHLQTAPPQRYNRSVGKALWDAVTAARNQLDGVKIGSVSEYPEKSEDGVDRDRKLRAVHGAIWCVLDAIICNPAAAALLADAPPQLHPTDPRGASLPCVALCSLWQSTFCPFEERYYDSPQALAEHYKEDFDFTPSSLPLESIDSVVFHSLTEQMNALLPRIFPSADFSEERERVRARLEHVLLTQLPETMFPRGSALRVFGSSSNGFGNDGADLDMCIEYARGAPHPEDAGALIESIADKLRAAGLLEVDSRPTARVPIVMFKDGESGLECDISVMNPLALRNTRLLKAYSEADPRIKELGYVVKHWAKRRLVNNASEGTLSSYGYLLCLVHFLQTRNPPVVPNLQALPPDWDGQTPPGFSNRGIPVVMTMQPFDGMECNTYFYDPMVLGREGETRRNILREFGSRNRSSSGELLAAFFRYFASELDCRSNVVSVRLGGLADRERKAEACCWSMHTRLSIEDPFETWYDVGHVLKWSRFKQVRLEFARAYALLARPGPEGLGDVSNLLETICLEAEAPPFTRLEERASHEGAEEMAEQLRLLDLDAHAL